MNSFTGFTGTQRLCVSTVPGPKLRAIWLMSHQTMYKALIFFPPHTAFSSQNTLRVALFRSGAVSIHMLLLFLNGTFNTTLTMVCAPPAFFHKQKPERITQRRQLSSVLIPNMRIGAGEKTMKGRNKDDSNTGPSLSF